MVNGFRHIVASAYSEFFEQAATFDYTSKSVKICCLSKKFILRTCNNM